jgi:hypothetical protein
VFIVLAPILPLITLLTYLQVFLREHVVFGSRTPAQVNDDPGRRRAIADGDRSDSARLVEDGVPGCEEKTTGVMELDLMRTRIARSHLEK